MTRDDIVDLIKTFLGRNFTGIDTVIQEAINTSIELFGNTISAIYDEAQWQHTFGSGDTASKVDNYQLPPGTKYILDATIIDPTGSEDTFYLMEGRSPVDAYEIDRLYARTGRPGFYTGAPDLSSQVLTWGTTFPGRSTEVTRVDQAGIPRFYWRIGSNIHIFPRNSSREEGWMLRVMLAMKPPVLTGNDSNSITENYPYALAHFAAGIVWGTRFKDQEAANSHYLLASQLLNAVASDQEISKLMGIRIVRA